MSNLVTTTPLSELPAEQWLAERAEHASQELGDCVESNPDKLGGVPVLKGSRISVAQILAEIGQGLSIEEVAEDFDLEVSLIKKLVLGLSVCFDRPVSR